MTASVRLLQIEDSEDDARLIARALERGGYHVAWERVDTPTTLGVALERQPWDVITCDWVMPEFSAPEALELLRERRVDVPIIIVSGEVGEEVAVTAMKAGAHDVLSKHKLARLAPAVERELREAEVRRERLRAEAALREREAELHRIVASVSEHIWSAEIDPCGNVGYRYCSPVVEEITGRRPEFYLAGLERWLSTIHPEDRPRLERVSQRVKDRQSTHEEQEYRVLRPDGTIRWVRGRLHVSRLETGGLRLDGVVTDITDRKQAEVVLHNGERHFRSLIENSLDLVAIVGSKGVLQYVSPSHEQVLGFKPEELIGRSILDLVDAEQAQDLRRRLSSGVKHGATVGSVEYRFRHKDGSWRHVEAIARNLLDDPLVNGILVNSRDITARKQAEESVHRLNEELKERLQALHRSEQRFAAVFRASPAAIGISTVTDGRLIDVNERCAEFLGYDRNELIGRTVMELGVWVDPAQRTHAIQTVLERGSVRNVEAQFRRKSGETCLALLSMERIQLSEEADPVLVVMFTDITESKRAHEQIVLQGTALAAAANAIVITDSKGQIIWTNPAFTQLTGYLMNEVIGQNPRVLKSGLHDQSFYEGLWKTLLSGQVWAGEITNRRKDGTLYDEEMMITPVRRDGVITHFIAIKQDVSERKRAEAEIQAANVELERRVAERTAELQRLNRELDAFSSSVSHDLRAPLRAIKGFSRYLLEDYGARLDADGRHYVDRINAGTHRMEQLIEDLLSLSRVTRKELTSMVVNLSDLAHAIAAELLKSEPTRRVEFIIAPELADSGDPHLLRVALENLLGNAWKYTGNHPAARIEFGRLEGNGASAYFVRDDGAGFDMKYAAKLFTAFQRLHSGREFEGTGVGLATVQRIIFRHGGRVWAEAAVEQGATFYFTLGSSAA